MIGILLVDDHPLVTERLETRLRGEADIDNVVTATSLATAQAALASQQFDVIVCDVRLPDGSGFELLDQSGSPVRRAPRFIMLSQFDNPQYIDAAQRLGAAGYLMKSAPTDEIVAAVRRVHAGGSAYAPELVRAGAQSPWRPLTPRERDVLGGLMRGQSNDEIASGLGVSRKTVEVYLSRLFARAEALSRTELAIRAERERWLDLPPHRV